MSIAEHVHPLAMIPWATEFRGEVEAHVPASWLGVYAVLAAYANRDGYSWPSAQRIGILARMDRNKAVKSTLKEMVEAHWLKEEIVKQGQPPKAYRAYKLTKSYATDGGSSRGWFSIGRAIIKNGVWAVMSPATRAVYATLKAHAWIDGHVFCPDYPNSLNDGQCDAEDLDQIELRPGFNVSIGQSNFLPFSQYDPARFHACASHNVPMTDRTYRNAMDWLSQNRLTFPYQDCVEEPLVTGFILPHDPELYSGDVRQAIQDFEQKAQQNRGKISAGAQRSITALQKRLSAGRSDKIVLKTTGNQTADFIQTEIAQHTNGNYTALQSETRQQ